MKSNHLITKVIVILAMATGAGCSEEASQARGFVLPVGDAAAGEQTFLRLECHQCHTVKGMTLPAEEKEARELAFNVKLGGPVSKVKTYGDLVTSVINPSHRIDRAKDQTTGFNGESFMSYYNDVMTVKEMVDIVTFLQSKYEIVTPPIRYQPLY